MIVKVLSILCLLFFSLSVIIGFGYQSTKNELNALESKHRQLEQVFKECSESKAKLVESNKQDEKIVVDQQEDLKELDVKEAVHIKQINNIPSKSCVSTAKPKVSNNETQYNTNDYVDIDKPYDDEYLRVFKSLSKDKGSSDTP